MDFPQGFGAVAALHQTSTPAAEPPLPGVYFGAHHFEIYTPQPRQVPATLNFNWHDPKVRKEYARIEEKALAGVANDDERRYYQQMKKNRNPKIFADRYLQDYVESRRLEQLSKKLSELQQFLRPLNLK